MRFLSSSEVAQIPLIPSNLLFKTSQHHAELVPSAVTSLEPKPMLVNAFNYLQSFQFDPPDNEATQSIHTRLQNMSHTDTVSDLTLIYELALRHQIPGLAVSVLMTEMNRTQSAASTERVNNVCNMLSVRQPGRDFTDLRRLFLLVNSFNKWSTQTKTCFKFSISQIAAILAKATPLTPESGPEYVAKTELVIQEIGHAMSVLAESLPTYNNSYELQQVGEISYSRLLHRYLGFCYTYINNRIRYNDPAAVYSTWNTIRPFHNKLYNSDLDSPNNNAFNGYNYYVVMGRMISLFSKNKRYRRLVNELIVNLPIEAVKVAPSLMSSLIYHCARTNNKKLANLLLAQYDKNTLGMPMKYSVGQLGALLSLALTQQKFGRAKEIIRFAKKNLVELSATQLNELVRATLLSHMENSDESAWQMIVSAEPQNARFAYISYLDHMINHRKHLDFSKTSFIFSHAQRAISDRSYWDYWNLSYFKYFDRQFSASEAIAVLKNNSSSPFKTLSDYKFYTNPFTTRRDKVRLRISPEVLPLILKDINTTAFKEGDKETMRWCNRELKKLGVSSQSLRIDVAKRVRLQARQIGFTSDTHMSSGSLDDRFLDNAEEFDKDWRR